MLFLLNQIVTQIFCYFKNLLMFRVKEQVELRRQRIKEKTHICVCVCVYLKTFASSLKSMKKLGNRVTHILISKNVYSCAEGREK